MKILIIDNNDSFTYNIIGLLKTINKGTIEVRNAHALSLETVRDFDKIIFSPGPGLPSDFPIMHQILETYKSQKSILGICLGHQAIGEYFGAELIHLPIVYHGQKHTIKVDTSNQLYENLANPLQVGLYHSWALQKENFPSDLQITGVSSKGVVMSISHQMYDIHGVQYHPESFISTYGQQIISNFLGV